MSKKVIEKLDNFYHYCPKIANIITVQVEDRMNCMTAAWHSPISFNPPLYGVSVSAKRFTYDLISLGKNFGINFIPMTEAELAASVGGSSGRNINKFRRFNITTDKSTKSSVPILSAAYTTYECRLVDDREYGDHHWLVGEIIAVYLEPGVFTNDDLLDLDNTKPLLYLGKEHYVTVGDTVRYLDRQTYGSQ